MYSLAEGASLGTAEFKTPAAEPWNRGRTDTPRSPSGAAAAWRGGAGPAAVLSPLPGLVDARGACFP